MGSRTSSPASRSAPDATTAKISLDEKFGLFAQIRGRVLLGSPPAVFSRKAGRPTAATSFIAASHVLAPPSRRGGCPVSIRQSRHCGGRGDDAIFIRS
jgi:hypothetical protein